MAILSGSFRKQVCHLLQKTHTPRVAVRRSQVPGAGKGVFYVGHRDEDSNLPKVLCLYPGIYTPPLPLVSTGIMGSQEDNNELMDAYLAKHMPPSQVPLEENAYILNLETVGGYLDGCALHSVGKSSRLDASPSACGHLVNHYRSTGDKPNVKVISFRWNDVLGQEFDDEMTISDLPNDMRCDGSPWYFDIITQDVVYFPRWEEEQTRVLHPLVAGAAIVSINDRLRDGQELFLDYQLRSDDLPKWAIDWYHA